jgi:glycosyltransferase involved in cell wall biosynthesis
MPAISIVIPVYNQEKYLRKCLNSIKQQTFRDFQAILVDDGSTDASAEICNEYTEMDSRFVYYYKENGGVSSTRQFGHDLVSGEYTIHCDPDDWVEPDWLETLYSQAVHTCADITICDFYQEYKDRSLVMHQHITSSDPEVVRKALFLDIHASLWNKLIKSSCYKNNNVKFPRGIDCKEDMIFLGGVIKFTKKISYVEKALYHYKMNDESITHSFTKDGIANHVKVLEYIRTLIDDAETLKRYDNRQMYSMLWYGWNCSDMSSEEFRKFSKKYRRRLLSMKAENWRHQIFFIVATYGPTALVKSVYLHFKS